MENQLKARPRDVRTIQREDHRDESSHRRANAGEYSTKKA